MRILIVEDNAKLSALLARRLEQGAFAVDIAATIDAANDLLSVAKFDLVLLDLTLPDGDGLKLLENLRRSANPVAVLIATARDDVEHRIKALNTGADDYIVKPFSAEELLARVHAILRRQRNTTGPIYEFGNMALDTRALTLLIDGRAAELTRREFDVLAAMIKHPGNIMPRERLEAAIYSLDAEVTPNAIEATISRLRRRLETNGASVAITAMRGLGYIIAEKSSR